MLPYFVPAAAVGLLLAVLLDSGAALMVMGVLAIVGGAIVGSLEFATYVFLGGMAGIIDHSARRARSATSSRPASRWRSSTSSSCRSSPCSASATSPVWSQLIGAGVLAAAGSAVAAFGTFAILGNIFGITTSFQLLELGNPSQPLLRRLLLETPGTYHHSLMVGNLAERAAEAIGADPLLARVAAYYHDIGKLNNPLAYIENQAGMARTSTTSCTPEQSVELLEAHVVGRHRSRLRIQAAQADHRVHPAAPRHGADELLLRPGEGAGGRSIRGRPSQVPPRRPQAAVTRGGHPDAGRLASRRRCAR